MASVAWSVVGSALAGSVWWVLVSSPPRVLCAVGRRVCGGGGLLNTLKVLTDVPDWVECTYGWYVWMGYTCFPTVTLLLIDDTLVLY